MRDAVQQNQQAVTDVKASAEGGNSTIRSGRKDTSLSISGQVNRMVFYADDGDQARWFHADNDKSSTRLRLVGKSALDGDWSAGTNIEVQFESNSTGDVTIRQNTAVAASNSFTERKLELWFANAQAGKLTLGQGPTASDGSVEEDLSGTTVITNASFADLGGSLAFRVSGTRGTSTGVTVGGLLSSQGGLSRDDRIRYDSPTLGGAKLSTSWVDGDEWDVALRYGINTVTVVNNNSSLNQEGPLVEIVYGGAEPGSDELWKLADIDFVAVAESLGCFGVQVKRPKDFSGALERALNCGRPAIVDVMTDIEGIAPPPWLPAD